MIRSFAIIATLLAAASEASAEPPQPRPVSLTLKQGVVAAHVAFEMNAGSEVTMSPASIAPDLSIGVFDRFTVSLVTSGAGLTGFRGSAGWGVCITGEDDGCRARYNAGGIEGLLTLSRGSLALAANAGVLVTSLEPELHKDLKVGFKLRLSEGRLFVLFSPSAWIAIDHRFARAVPHEDQLWLPISLWLKASSAFAAGIGTGVKGPLDGFSTRFSVPLGLVAQYALGSHVALGTSFVFGKLVGGSDVMEPGPDARAVQLWINVTSE